MIRRRIFSAIFALLLAATSAVHADWLPICFMECAALSEVTERISAFTTTSRLSGAIDPSAVLNVMCPTVTARDLVDWDVPARMIWLYDSSRRPDTTNPFFLACIPLKESVTPYNINAMFMQRYAQSRLHAPFTTYTRPRSATEPESIVTARNGDYLFIAPNEAACTWAWENRATLMPVRHSPISETLRVIANPQLFTTFAAAYLNRLPFWTDALTKTLANMDVLTFKITTDALTATIVAQGKQRVGASAYRAPDAELWKMIPDNAYVAHITASPDSAFETHAANLAAPIIRAVRDCCTGIRFTGDSACFIAPTIDHTALILGLVLKVDPADIATLRTTLARLNGKTFGKTTILTSSSSSNASIFSLRPIAGDTSTKISGTGSIIESIFSALPVVLNNLRVNFSISGPWLRVAFGEEDAIEPRQLFPAGGYAQGYPLDTLLPSQIADLREGTLCAASMTRLSALGRYSAGMVKALPSDVIDRIPIAGDGYTNGLALGKDGTHTWAWRVTASELSALRQGNDLIPSIMQTLFLQSIERRLLEQQIK